MARAARKKKAWIYKCRVVNGGGYSWIDPRYGGWLGWKPRNDGAGWGGEDWIRSPSSCINLAAAKAGDLIFCQQTDLNGIIGLTVAASAGYPDPDGENPERCSMIDLGPGRMVFDAPVLVPQIRAAVGEMAAFADGKRQHTFHAVEDRLLGRLLRLCCQVNPRQHGQIEDFCRLRVENPGNRGRAPDPGPPLDQDIIEDPVRREMVVEAFERRAVWAQLARGLYGYKCMVPGCSFKLVKGNGEFFIEVHHLQPMCEGGSPNDPKNLSVLCPNHHRAAHYGRPEVRARLGKLIRKEQRARLKLVETA